MATDTRIRGGRAKVLRRLLVTGLAVASLASGMQAGFATDRGDRQQMETKMSNAYTIGRMVNGSFEPLGTIAFDDAGQGKLEVAASGDEADRLRAAWEDVAAKDRLDVRRTRRLKTADGDTVTEFIGVRVERGSDDYPQAAIDYLSSEHGYFARPAR